MSRNPGPTQWFNNSVFSQLPAYTRRTNPWVYSGLTGPGSSIWTAPWSRASTWWSGCGLKLRMDVFNVLNNMTWEDPDVQRFLQPFRQIEKQQPGGQHIRRPRRRLGLRVQF